MISIGIDPSLRGFGWAIHDSEKEGRSRLVKSGHEYIDSKIVPVVRYMLAQNIVRRLVERYRPECAGIESPAYNAGPFQTIHHTLMMFCLVPIFENRIDCALFDPETLKNIVKGKENIKIVMDKTEMQRMVKIDTKSSIPINDNEADAYLLAKHSCRLFKVMDGNIEISELSETELKYFITKSKKVKTKKGTKVKKTGHVFKENLRFFKFSKVPAGDICLPDKSDVNLDIVNFLSDQ